MKSVPRKATLDFFFIGRQFGRLTISGSAERIGPYTWVPCKCSCGKLTSIRTSVLKLGDTNSCGCLHTERLVQINSKHGEYRTRLNYIWNSMIQRCTNSRHGAWANYGGRGITVSEEWASFEPFSRWAISNGYKDDLQIDRIDNNKGYSPNNCRWVTASRNCRNRRNTLILTAWGETKSSADWAEDPRCSVSWSTLYQRIKYGWPHEEALTLPPHATIKKALAAR